MESGYTFVHNLYLLAEWSKVCGAVKVAGTCASFEPLQAPVAISMALKKHYLCVCQLLDNLPHHADPWDDLANSSPCYVQSVGFRDIFPDAESGEASVGGDAADTEHHRNEDDTGHCNRSREG